MKKQINPTIKAYLIRSAFYLLLLIAICAIPLALAQRKATKVTTANPSAKPNAVAIAQPDQNTSSLDGTVRASKVRAPAATDLRPRPQSPTLSTRSVRPMGILPAPKLPNIILYDQYDNAGTNATSSQDFETAFDPFDD